MRKMFLYDIRNICLEVDLSDALVNIEMNKNQRQYFARKKINIVYMYSCTSNY